MSTAILTSPRTYTALGAFMAVDAVLFAKPVPLIAKTMETIHFPKRYWWIFPPIKVAAALGLFAVYRFPALARLTAAVLTLYFALAVGFHIRARDLSSSAASAATLMAIFAAMAAKGPAVRR